MTDSPQDDWIFDKDNLRADDGLPARRQGAYAGKKFEFLDPFLEAGLTAAVRKSSRVFLDLFAGPGRNRAVSGVEMDGSPLRAVRALSKNKPPVSFDRYIGINLNPQDHRALTARMARARAAGHVRPTTVDLVEGDANTRAPWLLRTINAQAWICVYADIENPSQLRWHTLEALQAGHSSVDLYALFPLNMGWGRMIADWRNCAGVFRAAFGNDAWQPICERVTTNAQNKQARVELLELYLERLRSQWTYAGVVTDVNRIGEAKLYRMIFATNNEAARNIAEHLQRRPRGGQTDLGL